MTPPQEASALVTYGIAVLAAVMAITVITAARKANPQWTAPAAVVVTLMAGTQWALAVAGILERWDRQPAPFMVLMIVTLAMSVFIALRWGGRVAASVSVAALVGSQAFRLPLELIMHKAATEGVMPVQMSYGGRNFDIITGATAILVALLAVRGRLPRWLLFFWNTLGSLLLINIVAVAVLSTPVFHVFDELNTWVAYPPFVWLPGILVPAALMGHILIWRKLFETPQATRYAPARLAPGVRE